MGTSVRDVTPVTVRLPTCRWPHPSGDALIAHLGELRPEIERLLSDAPKLALESVRMEAPVANPGKVIAVRSNYTGGAARAAIAGPELFLKAPSSVVGASAGIALRLSGRRVDHEVELVAVVGRRIDGASADEAAAAVAGYCIGIDVTMRGDEDRGLRKSLPAFTVLGPWLTTADEASGIADAAIELTVNGRLRQSGRTSQMSLGVGEIVAAASRYFPLEPGDVVMTGSPPGAGPLVPGDTVWCAIEGLGAMSVAVR